MIIAMTSIPVNSPVEAHQFYTETLGFTSKMFMPEMNLAIVVSPEDADGTALLLEPNDNPASKTFQADVYKQGLPLIVFGTADIQKEFERLRDKGVVFRKQPTKTDYGYEAVFEDTCGNLIQIAQL